MEYVVIVCDRNICDRNFDVFVFYYDKRVVVKKIYYGKVLFMVYWYGYCFSEKIWELKVYLLFELLEIF